MHTVQIATPVEIRSSTVDATRASTSGVVLRWTLAGVAFGLAFPLVGIVVASDWGFGPVDAHRRQSVLYIVDLAPAVLGVMGSLLGRVYRRLIETREAVERQVQERTAELTTALARLGDAQSQLVQSQKLEAIGSLAAGVAHEINTPIQYVGDNIRFLEQAFDDLVRFHQEVTALAEMVRAGQPAAAALPAFDAALARADLDFLSDEIPEAVTQALEGVQRVSEIVRALKAFSHPGTGDFEPVDVNLAVETTAAVSKNEWKYVAEMELHLAPDLPEVSGLAGPLNQALLVIVVNAAQAIAERIEHTPEPPGRIRITTSADADRVTISIEDNGGGIPASIRDSVFDPFFTTKPVGTGSGQGLSIAHAAVVDQHGGELRFEVTPDAGTTFIVELPVRPSDDGTG